MLFATLYTWVPEQKTVHCAKTVQFIGESLSLFFNSPKKSRPAVTNLALGGFVVTTA
jgi:hypothetical protein